MTYDSNNLSIFEDLNVDFNNYIRIYNFSISVKASRRVHGI